MLKLPEERRKWGESKEHLPQGLLFLLSPIFHCHKIKDGGHNNTNTNEVSPTQNTPALQATSSNRISFSLCLSLVGKIILYPIRFTSLHLIFYHFILSHCVSSYLIQTLHIASHQAQCSSSPC